MLDQTPPFPYLLGASGVLGRELLRLSKPQGTVATHRGRPQSGSVYFDARTQDVASLWAAQPSPPPSAIVMLGVTAIDACARDPQGTALTNVQAVTRVVDRLLEFGVMPVFISSDGVFDGGKAWWTETDDPNPILEYGRQKRLVERHVLASGRGLVVRLPKLIESGGDASGFLPGLLAALGKPEPMLCATDQFFTPASARDAAHVIVQLTLRGATGLYHVAGPQRLSRRVLLAEAIDEYRHVEPIRATIIDCRLADLPVLEPRPLDTSMACAKLAEHGDLTLRPAAEVIRTEVRNYFEHRSH